MVGVSRPQSRDATLPALRPTLLFLLSSADAWPPRELASAGPSPPPALRDAVMACRPALRLEVCAPPAASRRRARGTCATASSVPRSSAWPRRARVLMDDGMRRWDLGRTADADRSAGSPALAARERAQAVDFGDGARRRAADTSSSSSLVAPAAAEEQRCLPTLTRPAGAVAAPSLPAPLPQSAWTAAAPTTADSAGGVRSSSASRTLPVSADPSEEE